ncbi:MAG: type II toxin-antitoxin system HicA family toxin [Anaerolineae bacterium]|nr:MAG: type II toxin-antitoxin system HicA family toxin [Anaerolineae bacterium]
MPKLRRLSGKQILRILQGFGFEIYSQKGSHIRLQRIVDGQEQRLLVAVHGNKTVKPGTLKSIYREVCRFIPEEEIRQHFYTE